MAWNENAVLLAMKVIGTVESNFRWDAINYNDPITVGCFQWYGPRAANILNRMRNENAGSWTGVASSLTSSLTSHPSSQSSYWRGRYLTRAEGNSIKSVLYNNQAIQRAQMRDDLEDYKAVFTRNGGNADANTETLILFMCAWHQAPAHALSCFRAAGTSASMDRYRNVILNHNVLGKYRSRYNKAFEMIRAGDVSGMSPDPGDPDDDDAEPPDPASEGGVQPEQLNGMKYIVARGNNLYIQFEDGHMNLCPRVQPNIWNIAADLTIGGQVSPEPTPTPDPSPPPMSGNPGQRALDWMLAHQEKWQYSQGGGRLNPFQSGYTDCSATTYLAYKNAVGINIGTYTTPQSSFGREITRDRGAISRGEGLLPGDLIFYRNRVNPDRPWPHVEMFIDRNWTIGQDRSTSPGPSRHRMSLYLGWGKLAVMARRPWA